MGWIKEEHDDKFRWENLMQILRCSWLNSTYKFSGAVLICVC